MVVARSLASQELLNGANVGAALEQVSGEGMAEGVSADLLGQTGTADGPTLMALLMTLEST